LLGAHPQQSRNIQNTIWKIRISFRTMPTDLVSDEARLMVQLLR
jgi:hypothetical protein